MHVGARVGFFHGVCYYSYVLLICLFQLQDTQAVVDDVKELKPNLFVGVPRIYDRAKQAILKEVQKQSFPIQLVFKTAFALKKFHVMHGKFL